MERTLVLLPVLLCGRMIILLLAFLSMVQIYLLPHQTSTNQPLMLNNILYSALFSSLVLVGETTSSHIDHVLLLGAAITSHIATMLPHNHVPTHVPCVEWAVLGIVIELFLCIWFGPWMTRENTLSTWLTLMTISCLIIHRYHDLFRLRFTYLEYYMFIVMVGLIWEYVVLPNRFLDISGFTGQHDVVDEQNDRFGYATVVDVSATGTICTLGILTLTFTIYQFMLKSTISSSSRQTLQTYKIVLFLTVFTSLCGLILPWSLAGVLSTRHCGGGFNWMLDFLTRDDNLRLHLCGLWIAMIVVGGGLAWSSITQYHWSTVSSRKIFHVLIMAIILSGLFVESMCTFIVLAVSVACCGFIVLETFRIVVLVSNDTIHSSLRVTTADPLSTFYRHFIDDKDLDRHWLSAHLHLLIGCAMPIVLKACWESAIWRAKRKQSIEMMDKEEEWILPTLLHHTPLLPHLGWIVVGVGDSFAAIIGTKYGKHFWFDTKRSVEGSVGMLFSMIMATLAIFMFLHFRRNMAITMNDFSSSFLTLLATTFMEAFTNESDNLILPLFACALYIILVRIQFFYPFSFLISFNS